MAGDGEAFQRSEGKSREEKINRTGKKKLVSVQKRGIIYPKKAAERRCGSFSDNMDFFNFNFERDLSEAAALAVVLLEVHDW